MRMMRLRLPLSNSERLAAYDFRFLTSSHNDKAFVRYGMLYYEWHTIGVPLEKLPRQTQPAGCDDIALDFGCARGDGRGYGCHVTLLDAALQWGVLRFGFELPV